MARKLGTIIALGIITVLTILFFTGNDIDNEDILRQTFQVDAVYYESGHVTISYFDKSNKTNSVVMELLGMDESFQKTYSGSKFTEIVPFPNTPKYGWVVHPIVLDIDHEEFGNIQLKTEIHLLGEAAPPIIYSRP